MLLLPLFAGALSAQGTGVISGTVRDATSGQPVVSAQVNVLGTAIGAITNGDGQYFLRGLADGEATVRVLRIGYAEQRQRVTVAAGQPVTLDFQLKSVAASLSPVVSTATGEQRRIEVGNAISQLDAAELTDTRPIANVGDLLTGRVAGVTVFGGTQPGAGTRIRIRGTSSLSLSNNPIYIIDGIRMEGTTGSSSVSVGGTTPSRIGDLNPEEIENIEVVRGPSAATLYGTDAANGVIVITTKRGVAGKAQWTYYTEQSAVSDRNDYPTAFTGWRTGLTPGTTTSPTNANAVFCTLSQVAAGACVQDSVTSYNLTKDKVATPFGTGYRFQHGLQVRGGSEAVRYFLHTEYESEDGVTKVPGFERQYMATRGLSLTARQANPGGVTKATTRANLNISLSPQADVAVSTGYISQAINLPRSDDSGTPGIAANIYGGPGFWYNRNAAGDTLYGWREFTPRQIYQTETTQLIDRFLTSMSANWRPVSWVAGRLNAGIDFINRTDEQLCRFSQCAAPLDRQGFKVDNRTVFMTYTFDAGATATRTLSEALVSKTSVGVQFIRSTFDRNGARGDVLPPGAVQITAAAVRSADEATSDSRTLGGYIEQHVAFRDRLFVTGAIRSDRNSAFGANFKTVFYPKLSASWVISDEEFFPDLGWISQLRLRSAYGASGVQPGNTDALQYFSPSRYLGESGVEVAAVTYTTLGNRDLKPERSAEMEIGVDGTFWNSRLVTELTYYSKNSRDALVSRVLPPSLGTGATARLENIGEVKNAGLEVQVLFVAMEGENFGWNMSVNGTTTANRLVTLNGLPNIVLSSTLQHREGYPLNGWWSRGLTSYQDRNGDGIIQYNVDPAVSDIAVTDTNVYLGNPLPRRELVMTQGVDFWGKRIRVTAQLDYKGGFKVYNNTERIRCASRNNCESLFSTGASLADQARTVMVREHPSRSVGGFIEDGDFIRFREIAINATLPQAWAQLLRSRSVTASAAVRNLGILWTKYQGMDPEAFGTTGDAPSSFQAFGPPTYLTFRLNFGF